MEFLLLIIVFGLGGLTTSLLLFFATRNTSPHLPETYEDSQAFFRRTRAKARRMR